MPGRRVPSSRDHGSRPARGAQGPRRRDPLRDVRGARPLDRRAVGPGPRRSRSASTPTPSASTSSASARPAWSTSRPSTAAPSGGPSTSTSSPPARPGSGSTRRPTPCSPACSPRWPSGSAPTPTTPPRPAGSGAPRPARAPGPRSCLRRARGASSTGSGSSPRSSRATAPPRAAPASSSSTARSASWPRPTPSWCATCTAGSAKAWSTRSAGEESRSSRRCTTPSRATSWSGSGILRVSESLRGVRVRCSAVQDASTVFTLTDAAADKVKSLIEAEGNPELVLRVAVRPGGCSGLSYEMFFDTDVAADDIRTEHGGVTVVIDPASAPAPRRCVARLQGRPPGRRVRDQQPERRSAAAAAASPSASHPRSSTARRAAQAAIRPSSSAFISVVAERAVESRGDRARRRRCRTATARSGGPTPRRSATSVGAGRALVDLDVHERDAVLVRAADRRAARRAPARSTATGSRPASRTAPRPACPCRSRRTATRVCSGHGGSRVQIGFDAERVGGGRRRGARRRLARARAPPASALTCGT